MLTANNPKEACIEQAAVLPWRPYHLRPVREGHWCCVSVSPVEVYAAGYPASFKQSASSLFLSSLFSFLSSSSFSVMVVVVACVT